LGSVRGYSTPWWALPAACALVAAVLGAATGDAGAATNKAIWGPAEVDGRSQFPIYYALANRWPRIHTFGWFSLYAEPPNGPGGAPGNETNWGLLDWRGDRKPAYAAFKRG
jgi:hypothetical protein